MAEFATGFEEDALDLVQEAMMAWVRRYSHKPEEEWRPLFFRILQNKIRDWYRRQAVKRRVFGLVGGWFGKEDEESRTVEALPDPKGRDPASHLQNSDSGAALDSAIRELPLRQREAFLLRAWEEMSVADTARAMECSEGSVKTHYSRALAALRERLKEHGP